MRESLDIFKLLSGEIAVTTDAVYYFSCPGDWIVDGEPVRYQLHRLDGPAVEYADGTESWYLNGQRHRTDGPAVEYADGGKERYLNDRLHREDGPAVEWENGTKEWWLNHVKLTEAEFSWSQLLESEHFS